MTDTKRLADSNGCQFVTDVCFMAFSIQGHGFLEFTTAKSCYKALLSR